jgi:hypothetical protein
VFGELRADGAIGVARVVGQRAERAGLALRSRQEHVIRGGNREHVGHRPAVASARIAEPKRGPGSGAVGVTRAEAPVAAGHARPAGDLERDQHALADAARADLVSDRDHLGHHLVPDRERSGEEAHRRHRLIEIAPRDRERTYERAGRV